MSELIPEFKQPRVWVSGGGCPGEPEYVEEEAAPMVRDCLLCTLYPYPRSDACVAGRATYRNKMPLY